MNFWTVGWSDSETRTWCTCTSVRMNNLQPWPAICLHSRGDLDKTHVCVTGLCNFHCVCSHVWPVGGGPHLFCWGGCSCTKRASVILQRTDNFKLYNYMPRGLGSVEWLERAPSFGSLGEAPCAEVGPIPDYAIPYHTILCYTVSSLPRASFSAPARLHSHKLPPGLRFRTQLKGTDILSAKVARVLSDL